MKEFDKLKEKLTKLEEELISTKKELSKNRIDMKKKEINDFLDQCINESPEVNSLYDVRSGLLGMLDIEENFSKVEEIFLSFKKRYKSYAEAKLQVSTLKNTLTL